MRPWFLTTRPSWIWSGWSKTYLQNVNDKTRKCPLPQTGEMESCQLPTESYLVCLWSRLAQSKLSLNWIHRLLSIKRSFSLRFQSEEQSFLPVSSWAPTHSQDWCPLPYFPLKQLKDTGSQEQLGQYLIYIIHLLVNIPLKSATILKKIMIALLGQAELATFILKKVQIC